MGKKEAYCTQNSPLKATSICVAQGNENSIESFDLIGLGMMFRVVRVSGK